MKSIRVSSEFPGATEHNALRLVDERLWDHPDSEVESSGDSEHGWVVTVASAVDSDAIPSTLTSRLPQGSRLQQTLRLGPAGETVEGTFNAFVTGAPVDIVGTVSIVPADVGSTRIDIDAEVASSVPIFGSMVENALAPAIERLLVRQLEKMRDL